MRSIWARDLNLRRPSPFDKAEGPLANWDNTFGKWAGLIAQSVEWGDLDLSQPWDMWVVGPEEVPTIYKAKNELEFLQYPGPTYIKTEEAVYCRNLNTTVVTIGAVVQGNAVSLGASSLTPVYSTHYSIYGSVDQWESWFTLAPVTVNTVYTPFSGTLQVAYHPQACTYTVSLSGSAATPEFFPVHNTIDQHGLLLGYERLPYEDNVDYMERMRGVLGGQASADPTGVAVGVARRTGNLRRVDWSYFKPYGTYYFNIKDTGAGPVNTGAIAATLTYPGSAWGLRRHALSFDGTSLGTVSWATPMSQYYNDSIGIRCWVKPTTPTSSTVQSLLEWN